MVVGSRSVVAGSLDLETYTAVVLVLQSLGIVVSQAVMPPDCISADLMKLGTQAVACLKWKAELVCSFSSHRLMTRANLKAPWTSVP